MMIRTRGALLLAALMVVVPIFSARAAGAETELQGMWASTGTNPDGSEYKGLVHITQRGDSLIVRWMFPKNSNGTTVLVANSVGVGIVSDGMLAVSYYGAGAAGIVLYKIEEGGERLAGHWTLAGENGNVYSETLVKLPWRVAEPGTGDAPESEAPPPGPTRKPVRPRGSGEV